MRRHGQHHPSHRVHLDHRGSHRAPPPAAESLLYEEVGADDFLSFLRVTLPHCSAWPKVLLLATGPQHGEKERLTLDDPHGGKLNITVHFDEKGLEV